MPLMEWTENLYVEIPRIDQQHKRLVEMLNELHDAVQQKRAKDVIGGTLTDLLAYTETHFALEEEYFDKYGYFDAENHKASHQALTEEVRELLVRYKSTDGETLGVEVLEFLKDWLYRHILGADKKYAPFFKIKGFT